MEAGELLGCRSGSSGGIADRYEEDGVAGLVDKRLGKASAAAGADRRSAADALEYRTAIHAAGTSSISTSICREQHNFRWGYTWVKTQLHTAGLVERCHGAARTGASGRASRAGHDAAPGRQSLCVA